MANYISKIFKAEQHKMLGDFHTHTVYSLHGMSSPSEVVQAAINAVHGQIRKETSHDQV